MLSRATQTNEPARCAVLLPVLARLPQPLALLEVGASAGLCLLPDHYGYDYGAAERWASWTERRRCSAARSRRGCRCRRQCRSSSGGRAWISRPATPPILHTRHGWRHWSGRSRPSGWKPEVGTADRGDATAPDHARRSADGQPRPPVRRRTERRNARRLPHRRAWICRRARGAGALCGSCSVAVSVWVSNEVPLVFPDIARTAGPAPDAGRFLLSVNGAPVAWTDPHGAGLDWIAPFG